MSTADLKSVLDLSSPRSLLTQPPVNCKKDTSAAFLQIPTKHDKEITVARRSGEVTGWHYITWTRQTITGFVKGRDLVKKAIKLPIKGISPLTVELVSISKELEWAVTVYILFTRTVTAFVPHPSIHSRQKLQVSSNHKSLRNNDRHKTNIRFLLRSRCNGICNTSKVSFTYTWNGSTYAKLRSLTEKWSLPQNDLNLNRHQRWWTAKKTINHQGNDRTDDEAGKPLWNVDKILRSKNPKSPDQTSAKSRKFYES